MAGLGRISYSLYLYDVPIKLLVYRHVDFLHDHATGFVIGSVASTVLVAWLSHRLVETRWHPLCLTSIFSEIHDGLMKVVRPISLIVRRNAKLVMSIVGVTVLVGCHR